MLREQRKADHIKYALKLRDGSRKTGLKDVRFLHNCLTPVDPDRVDTGTRIGNLELPVPVFIDAITGGAAGVKEINRKLAVVAGRTGVAMAVGKASVFKFVADDYPTNIGAVSGIVGLAGGMGGFLLPIMFGMLEDFTGIRSTSFMLLYGTVCVSLIWMHFSFKAKRKEIEHA